MIEPQKDNLNELGNFEATERGQEFSIPENEAPILPEKETAQEISSAERDQAYQQILSKISDDKSDNRDHEIEDDAQEAAKIDTESRVNYLVEIALNKGVAHAVKVARRLEDYYLLDTLHDRLLADDLHEALLAKGVIKEK